MFSLHSDTGVDWAYDPAIGLGDLASSEAAAYPFNKEDPMYKLWNGVVHKKAAYVVKFLAMGLDVLVCAHQPAPTHHNFINFSIYVCIYILFYVMELGNGQVTDVDIVFLKDPLPLFSNKTIDLFFIDDTNKRIDEGKPPRLCGGPHTTRHTRTHAHTHTHTRTHAPPHAHTRTRTPAPAHALA
jgi:hypothetical protein